MAIYACFFLSEVDFPVCFWSGFGSPFSVYSPYDHALCIYKMASETPA